MENLPAELTVDILSKLPVKTIIHCKLVCKKWRNLVSDSSFVNLHLSRSSPTTTGFIVHQTVNYQSDGSLYSGIFKWVEIEDKVDHHHLHYETILDLSMVPIFQNSLISQMGSVNGLICLYQYSPECNTYICNPVTREIITIPAPRYHKHGISGYGFGVSSLTGEYKVVRTFQRKIPFNGNGYKIVPEAEVYTLGTRRQWRSVGQFPYWLVSKVAAVLNDHCHWIVFYYEDASARICSFDLNNETFQLFPSPPSIEEIDNSFQSLAVLKGCLCMSDGDDSQLTIWVMKEYGIKKSWHKEVVITRETLNSSKKWLYNVSLIEGLKDGTIFFMSGGLCAFYPRSDTVEEIHMFDSSKRGLAYRPSFLKLQNFESERVHMF